MRAPGRQDETSEARLGAKGHLTLAASATTLRPVRAFVLRLVALGALGASACGGSSAATPTAASSSSLSAQTTAAATPSVTLAVDFPMSDEMYEAQLLCTTTLTYAPCGLVAGSDTVNCFMLCQAQIAAGATNVMVRGALDCAARPPEPADAASPACDFVIADQSPVDAVQLRAECNAKCKELQADGGVAPP